MIKLNMIPEKWDSPKYVLFTIALWCIGFGTIYLITLETLFLIALVGGVISNLLGAYIRKTRRKRKIINVD